MPCNTDTPTVNPFRELWKEGDVLTYLDLDMVVVNISDSIKDNTIKKSFPNRMTTEYLNTRNEIQTKVFYSYHIPSLKVFI